MLCLCFVLGGVGEIQVGCKEDVFYNKGGEALAQVAQRAGGCPIPGDTQGQAGQGSEHLMELQMSLIIAGQLEQVAFKDPSNSNHSMTL